MPMVVVMRVTAVMTVRGMPGLAGAVPAAASCRCWRVCDRRVCCPDTAGLAGSARRSRRGRTGPCRGMNKGAAVGGAVTGTVGAARAAMLAQAPAPAGTDAAMTGVAVAASERPRR
jgi:hypothetical protein